MVARLSDSPDVLQEHAFNFPTDFSTIQTWSEQGSWNWGLLRDNLPIHLCTKILLHYPMNLTEKAFPVWKLTEDGNFSTKSARLLIRSKRDPQKFFGNLWSPVLSPTISIFSWKVVQGWLPVETKMQKFGISLASKCQCCTSLETIEHVLLFNCEINKVWMWFSNLFAIPCMNTHSVLTRFLAWHNSIDFVCKGHIRTIVPQLIVWYSCLLEMMLSTITKVSKLLES